MASKPQREGRRRRVLREETRPTGKSTKRRTSANERAYSEQALHENQPKISDCLPKRALSIFLLFAFGVASIGAIQSLYIARVTYLEKYPQIDTKWLELTGPMTLSSFWSAAVLMMTALLGMFVFHVRRFRVDDYKGRYRMWYMAIIGLAVASFDSITHAHDGVRDALTLAIGDLPWEHPALGWIVVYGALGGMVALRGLVEVRRSKATVFIWTLSIACFVGATLLYVGVFQITPDQSHRMARSSLFLSGVYLLMFGMAIYARFVFLEAQSDKGARASSKKRSTSQKSQSKEPKRTGLFKLPTLRRRKSKATSKQVRKSPAKASQVDDDLASYEQEDPYAYDDDYESSPTSDAPTDDELELLTDPNLTRSERRKLKKQFKMRRSRAA